MSDTDDNFKDVSMKNPRQRRLVIIVAGITVALTVPLTIIYGNSGETLTDCTVTDKSASSTSARNTVYVVETEQCGTLNAKRAPYHEIEVGRTYDFEIRSVPGFTTDIQSAKAS